MYFFIYFLNYFLDLRSIIENFIPTHSGIGFIIGGADSNFAIHLSKKQKKSNKLT